MTLKLRVQFTIDIEAIDFVEAAEHQRVLQGFAAKLLEDYPLAAMHIKERRLPRLVQQKPSPPLGRSRVVTPYASRRHAKT